jgi:NAD dependent epimerase/dehydratase family enzyme
MILLALDEARASGPMNGTSPAPLPNREFARALGRALRRPSFMPTPAFALRVMLGKVAGVITKGQRVLPRKACEWGYVFKFPDIDSALSDALS